MREALAILAAPALAGRRPAAHLRNRVLYLLLERARRALDAGDLAAARDALGTARSAERHADETDRLTNRLAAAARECGAPAPADVGTPFRADRSLPDRFMLRVEEGPEALVLAAETVRIGNALDPANDIAIMANLSSCHARIRRELRFHGGVTYLLQLEGDRNGRLNGRRVREAVLTGGDEIDLGAGVRLRFAQPDPASATALLEILAGHPVDDIRTVLLLKAPGKDGRIRIGNAERTHLRVRGADRILAIHVAPAGANPAPCLWLEADGEIEVDGVRHRSSAPLHLGAYVRCGSCGFQIGRCS
ncbi:MAG: hypothetical protein JXQ29_16050 [Planctomycetes bacterium]|nr:hypothetical protein [Planctomycetota bacterium]